MPLNTPSFPRVCAGRAWRIAPSHPAIGTPHGGHRHEL